MAENWQSATRVQKNDAGEYRALIGGAWVPAMRAQKNESGEFRVILADGASMADQIPDTLPQAEAQPDPTIGDRVKRQLGLGARAIIKGATAIPTLMAEGAAIPLRAATGGKYFQSPSAALDRGLTDIGLPEPSGTAERVTQDVIGAMGGQGAMIGVGRVMSNAAGPVVSRIGDMLKSQPTMQLVGAGTGGASASAAKEGGAGPIGQTAAGLVGGMAPIVAANVVTRQPVSQVTQGLLNESRRRDVPLTYSDITGKGRRMDVALEQVPVLGVSKFREMGAKKVTAAIEGYADDVAQSMRKTDYRGLDRLQAAAKAGDRTAQNTLNQINNAGDDWTKIMQASGNLKLWRAREAADELYGRVERIANTRGEVPLNKTVSTLDSAIAAESQSKLPDQQLIAKLTEIKNNLGSGNNFSAMRQLRSDIGDLVNSYYKGANAVIGAKGVDKLQSVKAAVEADMEQFAMSGGGDLKNAWKRADQFYKTAVVPYKDRALATSLKSDLPDEIYKKFVQVSRAGSGEDRAQKFYNALDPKGKAAVRYGMIANAIDNATIPEKEGFISPGKFEQSLENIKSATGVFFKGGEKSELDGFRNLMEHSRRFGQFTENPPTGQRVIPWLMLGGAAIRPAEVAVVGAAAYVARQLVTTEAGKKFLLEASVLKPGSPAMQKLSDELARQMPRLLNQQVSQNNKEQQGQQMPNQSTGPE